MPTDLHSHPDDRNAVRAVALTVVALAVGVGIHFRDGEYMFPSGRFFYPPIWYIGAALAAAGVALFPPRLPVWVRMNRGELVTAVLLMAAVVQFALLINDTPSGRNTWADDLVDKQPANLQLYFGGLSIAAGLLALLAICRRWFWTIPFAGLLVIHFLLGCWLIRSSPEPFIDVWHFQQIGAATLVDGRNPYSATYPDIYGRRAAQQRLEAIAAGESPPPSTDPAYGGALTDGRNLKFGFPYPPVSLALSTLGWAIAGDHRYAQAAALTLAGLLLVLARPTRQAALAAVVLIFTPRAFFILGRGWTEPLVVFLLSLTVLTAIRFPRLLPIALGLFLASKQYLALAAPLAWLLTAPPHDRKATIRLIGGALLVALIVSLPLAAWDVQAFFRSTVTAQTEAPFRTDALSWLVWFYDRTGVQLGTWVAFVLATASLAACLRWCPRTPAGFCAGLSAVYLPFIAFNKQAFANYYLLVIAAAAAAVAALSNPSPGGASDD